MVIWSGQWSAVSCCDSVESEDEVLIDDTTMPESTTEFYEGGCEMRFAIPYVPRNPISFFNINVTLYPRDNMIEPWSLTASIMVVNTYCYVTMNVLYIDTCSSSLPDGHYLFSMRDNQEYARYIRLSATDPEMQLEPKFLSVFGDRYKWIVGRIMYCRNTLREKELHEAVKDIAKNLKIRVNEEQATKLEKFADAIDYLVSCAEHTSDEGIYVGTIHSVKGLEYDIVHVIGVNGRCFPVFRDEDNMACFYVACTRAKSDLTIWCETSNDKYPCPEGMFVGLWD